MDRNDTLHILWTNADPHTARFMVMMYAKNSMIHGWWKSVTVIIWGATAALAAENGDIQEEIKLAQSVGVKFSACQSCARQLGVVEKLEALGVEMRLWGMPLTELIKDGENLITV
jgi:hypothetical protein